MARYIRMTLPWCQAVLILFFSIYPLAAAESRSDLWDISNGISVTATSGIRGGFSAADIFGAKNSTAEPGQTVFRDDRPQGFVHFIEWQTTKTITLNAFRVFADDDGASYFHEREFGQFILKGKLSASDPFVTLYTSTPAHPYIDLDPPSSLVIDASITPFNARYFRAEFVQWNAGRGFDGPRILELDGFGSASGISESRSDLFDVSQGAQVLVSSGTFPGFVPEAMFGSDRPSAEPGTTIFGDGRASGYVHFVEWKTARPVELNAINLFASGDPAIYNYEREFERFTLQAKLAGSDQYSTIYTFTPSHPYTFADPSSSALISTKIPPVQAQYFRAEFIQKNAGRGYDGPRVVELDGFGSFVEPGPAERPSILVQPQPQITTPGGSATFSVTVGGTGPFSYQWLLNNLTIPGATSAVYQISNTQIRQLGNYRVLVQNQAGLVISTPAALTLATDVESPSVVILSPASGTTQSEIIAIDGIAADNVAITSLLFQQEANQTQIPLLNGRFSVPNVALKLGENILRVIAYDAAGNQASASVTLRREAPRTVSIPELIPTQEGGKLNVPILLSSNGDVAAATLNLTFNPAYLSEPTIQWPETLGGWAQFNASSTGEVRLAFALPGTVLPSGTQQIAMVHFRVRSIPQALSTPLGLEVLGVYSSLGDPLNSAAVLPRTAQLVERKYAGDNNANDRLDVADASAILRWVAGLEPIRAWDTPKNDLNKNNSLDAGDAIKVLRAAVNLDPQPGPAMGLTGQSISIESLAGPRVILKSDQVRVESDDEITVRLWLDGGLSSLAGCAFRIQYPSTALRLQSAASYRAGSMVGAGTLALWNPTADESDNGTLYAALSSPTTWSTNSGELAVLTFRAIDLEGRNQLQLRASGVEISNGSEVETVGSSELILEVPSSTPESVTASLDPGSQAFSLTIHGLSTKRYRLESSEDLKAWSEVGTYAADASGPVLSQKVEAGQSRFYRTVLVP